MCERIPQEKPWMAASRSLFMKGALRSGRPKLSWTAASSPVPPAICVQLPSRRHRKRIPQASIWGRFLN
jgi:hypothetical protein